MIELIVVIVTLIVLNLETQSKWGLYTTTIIFNNILNFIVVMLLYLSYFNNKISGTTFICSLITLVFIYYLIYSYKTIKKQRSFLMGYIISAIPLLTIIYFEVPILNYEKLDYHVTVYLPTEPLDSTQISILAVGSIKIDEKDEQKLNGHIMLNKNEISNIERYLANTKGIFYNYFGGNSFRDSLANAEFIVGKKIKTIKQMENKPNVAGDSAGLAMTLGSFIELQALSNNIPIAVTGAIDNEGNVKAVGAIEEKVTISVMDGFEYLIVPSANFEEAQLALEKSNKKISIIPVSSINEAKLAIEDLNIE